MIRLSELKLALNHSPAALTDIILTTLHIPAEDLISFDIFKRSYDARNKKNILLIYQLDVQIKNETKILEKVSENKKINLSPGTHYKMPAAINVDALNSSSIERPLVIGFGPCGILAALLLAQMGLKPIVLERGQDVRQRTKDTWGLWRQGKLNTESNVQFGEGGAGTFSDGKLHTLVKDRRFLGRKVLEEFVKAGAPAEILYLSKPHIGTFKLVKMVEKLRAEIVSLGGEVRFNQKVADILLEPILAQDEGQPTQQIQAVKMDDGSIIKSRHVVLAIGHSARDSFQMLFDSGVYIEAKPFSIGFRIEHPQSLIDEARFGSNKGNPILGAADYKLVHHCKNGRSVYSFCMCPGGTVVAATSEHGRVVTNGMSQYSRNERNANSAIVCGITPEQDFPSHVLAGIDLQIELESLAYQLGGENYFAPAQLLGDFMNNKASTDLGEVTPSYKPGIKLTDLRPLLPDYAINAIQEAIPIFNKKIKGFALEDAVLTGVETRTSSPICIKRGQDFQNLSTRGLYPAGEGAGYAGGILSAAIDGIKVAEAITDAIAAQIKEETQQPSTSTGGGKLKAKP